MIVVRVVADSRLEAGKTCRLETSIKFAETTNSVGDIMRECSQQWTIIADEEEIQQHVGELMWFVTALFRFRG